MSKIENGEKISFIKGQLNVPKNPIIPFIEGDGIGPDIWYASQKVFNKAVAKAYDGEKNIVWKEVYQKNANAAIKAPSIVQCKQCNAYIQGHRACPECGYYNGRQVTSVESDE